MSTQISEEENERRFDAGMKVLIERPIPPFIEWWEVETCWAHSRIPTWWKREVSTQVGPIRFKSHSEALQAVKSWMTVEDYNKFRIVHVTLERSDTKRVTTETWTEVTQEA
jgi:hypothetical protein